MNVEQREYLEKMVDELRRLDASDWAAITRWAGATRPFVTHFFAQHLDEIDKLVALPSVAPTPRLSLGDWDNFTEAADTDQELRARLTRARHNQLCAYFEALLLLVPKSREGEMALQATVNVDSPWEMPPEYRDIVEGIVGSEELVAAKILVVETGLRLTLTTTRSDAAWFKPRVESVIKRVGDALQKRRVATMPGPTNYTTNISNSNVGAAAIGPGATATGTVSVTTTQTWNTETHRRDVENAQAALVRDQSKIDAVNEGIHEALHQFLRIARKIDANQEQLGEAQAKMKATLDELWAKLVAEDLKPKLPAGLDVTKALLASPALAEAVKAFVLG